MPKTKRAARKLSVNRVIVNAGAAKQAIKLLRWWAEDCSDEPRVVEMIKQSKECARDLEHSLAAAASKEA